jgi:CP family cyanate transporter-like MFS transporter
MGLMKNSDTVSQIGRKSAVVTLWAAAVAVVIVGLNLRPAITAVAPLLDQIQRQEGFSSTVASLLTSIPLVCFVVFSPLAPRIGRKLGLEVTIWFSLVVLVIGFLIRLIPTVGTLFLGTAVVGLAITAGNVLLPAVIKRDYPTRTGLMMGLYTMSLYLGPAAAAGFTLPLQRATGLGWRGTLSLWAILAVIGFMAWIPQLRARHDTGNSLAARPTSRTLWMQPLAWAITLFFAVLSLLFYTVSAWLPTILGDGGMSHERAGGMLAVINITAIPFALIMSILVSRTKQQIWATTLGTTLLGIGLLGILLLPNNGTIAWMILFGMGHGTATGIGYSLALLRSRDAQVTAELSAMSQAAGYLFSACGPILAGILHDLTHTWTIELVLLIVLVFVQMVSGFSAGRDRILT